MYFITSGKISLISQGGESQLGLSVKLIISFINTSTYKSATVVLLLSQTRSLHCDPHKGRRTIFP